MRLGFVPHVYLKCVLLINQKTKTTAAFTYKPSFAFPTETLSIVLAFAQPV